jgi:hypothetical protein
MLRGRLVFAALGALFAAPALAADGAAPARSATPLVVTKAIDFTIEPERSEQTFMCESGRLRSVSAVAVGERRPVSILLVDAAKAPFAQGVWSEAFGFRLEHKQSLKVRVIMFCGE